jgi:hypothetical protein
MERPIKISRKESQTIKLESNVAPSFPKPTNGKTIKAVPKERSTLTGAGTV